MNLDAVWHDLECGGYTEDLPLWRELAARTGGPVLDVGAGTGRVTLELAADGVEVVALDADAQLLAALAVRAGELPVETVVADAREFRLGHRFALIIVPMQTLQLLGGRDGRAAFLSCAYEHLEPGGLIAAALADAMDCFDEEHEAPPPPQTREILGVRYASQLLGVVEASGRAAIRRRREVGQASDRAEARDVVIHLDRVSADEVAAEAGQLGFVVEPHLQVPENEQYLGSTVVVLERGPPGRRAAGPPGRDRSVNRERRASGFPRGPRAGARLRVMSDQTTTDQATRVAELLHEAGETHHRVYRIVDGDDPDWASWYADWLINLSELPELLGTKPVRSELVWMLVGLDKEYTERSPDAPWPDYYAERLISHLGD